MHFSKFSFGANKQGRTSKENPAISFNVESGRVVLNLQAQKLLKLTKRGKEEFNIADIEQVDKNGDKFTRLFIYNLDEVGDTESKGYSLPTAETSTTISAPELVFTAIQAFKVDRNLYTQEPVLIKPATATEAASLRVTRSFSANIAEIEAVIYLDYSNNVVEEGTEEAKQVRNLYELTFGKSKSKILGGQVFKNENGTKSTVVSDEHETEIETENN